MKNARRMFESAAFVHENGIELVDCGPGWCESRLTVKSHHLQQNGFLHAGLQATIADHTAGAAACSLIGSDEAILSIEFKLNLLRPGIGESVRCRGEVIKPGKTVIVTEAWVYSIHNGQEKLVSKMTATMAVVARM
ncbi:MAG: PaaI family thioesterase [SAR324 cluster bacterium]|nr:PaaI family thioesterase [SAR324 cluster bacterium]MBF0352929.1 PaaI family thioesterase [SAR324 cluster bacterium]